MRARVRSRKPLLYHSGADASIDQPAHVRAGSSLRHFGDRLVVVQDDANFLAVLSADGTVQPVVLPAGPGGLRQFDELRGNKKHKLDLEACTVVSSGEKQELWAFGSGSSPARFRIVRWSGDAPMVVDAARWYQHLLERKDFSGSELNIEGALVHGEKLLLFQRGNGAPSATHTALDAVGAVALSSVFAFLEDPTRAPVPTLESVRVYELGVVDGAKLTFTDAALVQGNVYYSAAAEASPDATRDGPVTAVALGMLREDGSGVWALLEREDGTPLLDKVEGIAPGHDTATMLAVVDRDEPNLPAELLEIHLEGSW